MLPKVDNLLLCDYLSIDNNGKPSCCGIFSNVNTKEFPYPFTFYIFAVLLSGHGKQKIDVELENVFTGEKLITLSNDVDFNDPLKNLFIFLQFKVIFNQPGQYSINIICEKHLLRSEKLNVNQIK